LSISPKAEYFTRPGLRGQFVSRLFREFGHVPVDRADTHAAAATIQTGVDLLADGKALGIYPEGTRSPDGRLHKFHTGVARHALRSGAPVIPVGLIGTDRVLIASDRRWHRSRRVPACPRRRRAERSRHDCPLAGQVELAASGAGVAPPATGGHRTGLPTR
jgi:1-acyl-sn-glycerol-3-phosphate acyltransferase